MEARRACCAGLKGAAAYAVTARRIAYARRVRNAERSGLAAIDASIDVGLKAPPSSTQF